MSSKHFPFTRQQLSEIVERFPTPFYLYDEGAIRANAKRIARAFSVFPGFKEHFAVKALPNPFVLKVLADEGFGATAPACRSSCSPAGRGCRART